MVKNLLIARKTCRPMEGVGMFIILEKNYILLNDRFRLTLVKILTPEKIFKRVNVNEKSRGMEKREEKNLREGSSSNEQMARD